MFSNATVFFQGNYAAPIVFWSQACQASGLPPDCLLFHQLSAQQGVGRDQHCLSDTCATISLHIVSSVISFQITLVLALALSVDGCFQIKVTLELACISFYLFILRFICCCSSSHSLEIYAGQVVSFDCIFTESSSIIHPFYKTELIFES